MSTSHKAILETANAAIQRGDNEGFLTHCTEDTEWKFMGDRVLAGKEAVRKWMAETYQEPPQFVVRHLIEDGDYVVALGDIVAKDEEGNDADFSYCDVWRFRGDKMAELRAFVIKKTPSESKAN